MKASRRRKIHVALPEAVHRKLRVKAAVEDISMQAFVAHLISESVRDVRLPARHAGRRGRPLTGQALLDSGLVGIWENRKDIGDSVEFARKLRAQAERRDGG